NTTIIFSLFLTLLLNKYRKIVTGNARNKICSEGPDRKFWNPRVPHLLELMNKHMVELFVHYIQ
ncbi:MAG: hypothetical protein RR585_09325, partial [Coprobacillus sp.]